MSYFHYQHGELFAEDVPLKTIAETTGTPCYVYSTAALKTNWLAFDNAFQGMSHRICYAVKANSNLAILNLLSKLGSGFDIVSQGELERVLAAGGDPKKIIFSGIGKSSIEIKRALDVGIHCFNIESADELTRLEFLAKQANKIAPVALRVNPNIDAKTHPYISTGLKENKFGIEMNDALKLCQKIKKIPQIKLTGVACHIGSQLLELSPLLEAVDKLVELIEILRHNDIILQHIDIGGGLGVQYQNESPPSIEHYAIEIEKKLRPFSLEIILAPGRAIAASAGILLTRVEYLKHTTHKNFAIVDAAMNDLLRPALYHAWQSIIPVVRHSLVKEQCYDIVGPVCESADFLGKDRLLSLKNDDLLAIQGAGAYGFSMSSNYNSRPRAAEILVDQKKTFLIRPRETFESLFANETIAAL